MKANITAVATLVVGAGIVLAVAAQQAPAPAPAAAAAPPAPMTFFITSEGSGKGGDLGGLAGADAHCQKLATAVGAGARTWRAYLSTAGRNGGKVVNARDRIGPGPWHNAKGEQIAKDVADLHGDVERDRNNIHKGSALNEKGEAVTGRGETPNRHDMLTGSSSVGRAIAGTEDNSCSDWTSSSTTGGAMVGHHDRNGGGNTSWNAVHRSRGCALDQLKATGGDGLFYCFAEK
jgi:hypothetical protein